MGENSQLKPESGVILKKSLSISLQKSGFEKKSLSLGLKNLSLKKSQARSRKIWSKKCLSISPEKSLSISLKNIQSQNKSRNRSRKKFVSKKSLSINLGNIWSREKAWYRSRMKFLVSSLSDFSTSSGLSEFSLYHDLSGTDPSISFFNM